MARQRISSGSPFEKIIGFSRAVKVGYFSEGAALIVIGGTAPIGPDGKNVAPGDPTAQAQRCFEIIKAALEEAGASLQDVIRTRILLTRIEDWEAVAQVRAAYLRDVCPVDTVMQVSRFIDPEWLVEIEVDAVVEKG